MSSAHDPDVNWDQVRLIGWVAIGGALGSVLRFLVQGHVNSETFPWGTFAVNLSGSFLLALVFFSPLSASISPEIRALLFVGIFGGFTTLSTFSLETVGLMIEERWWLAAGNIFLTGIVCVMGAVAGRIIGQLVG